MSEKQRKTCIVYCRTSTARQRAEETIGAQIERCKQIVQHHGLAPLEGYGEAGDGWVIDDGTSGTLLESRRFAGFLDDLESSKVRPDFLVVFSLSRISRVDKVSRDPLKIKKSHADAALIQSSLISSGVQVIDEAGIHDPSSLTFQILLVLANEEFKQIRSRTMSGKARRLGEGKYARGGRGPYGYAVVPANGVDRRASYTLAPCPTDAPRLLQILSWYIDGGVTFAARKATEAGFPTPMSSTSNRKNQAKDWSPTRWSPVSVQHITRNVRAYLGEQTLVFDNQPHTLRYEPIITHELYAQVERRKKERTLKKRAVMLTTGLATCACGGNLHAKKSSIHHYAHCKDGKGECGSFRHDLLENYLWIATVARLVQIMRNEGERRGDPGDYGERIKALESQAQDVLRRINILVDMRFDGSLDDTVFKQRNGILNDEKARIQSEIAKIKAEREAQAKKEAQEQTLEARLRVLLVELTKTEPSLDRKREVLSDLLAGGRVVIGWGPRQFQGRAIRQSEWAELRFPSFGKLPEVSVRIGEGHDIWKQMLEGKRVAGIHVSTTDDTLGSSLAEWVARVRKGETNLVMSSKSDGKTSVSDIYRRE